MGRFIDTSERPVLPVRQASFLNQGYKLCQSLGQWLSTLAAHCHLGRELRKLMPGSHTKDSDVMGVGGGKGAEFQTIIK